MFSTAERHLWPAEYEGPNIVERVVGYAAEECNRITELGRHQSIIRITDSGLGIGYIRIICGVKHYPGWVNYCATEIEGARQVPI